MLRIDRVTHVQSRGVTVARETAQNPLAELGQPLMGVPRTLPEGGRKVLNGASGEVHLGANHSHGASRERRTRLPVPLASGLRWRGLGVAIGGVHHGTSRAAAVPFWGRRASCSLARGLSSIMRKFVTTTVHIVMVGTSARERSSSKPFGSRGRVTTTSHPMITSLKVLSSSAAVNNGHPQALVTGEDVRNGDPIASQGPASSRLAQ